jgi:hypothetical protein
MSDDFVSLGEALARRPPRRDAVMVGRPTGLERVVITKAGQTLYLTAEEAAATGLRCSGSGEARICQFGLWRDDRGEWVYPPRHDPDDLDGARYRAALLDLRLRQDARKKDQQQRPQRHTPAPIAGWED